MLGRPKFPKLTRSESLVAVWGKNKDVKIIISDIEVIIFFLTFWGISYFTFLFSMGLSFTWEIFVPKH